MIRFFGFIFVLAILATVVYVTENPSVPSTSSSNTEVKPSANDSAFKDLKIN